MTTPRSDFLHYLVSRGYVHQCTDLEGLDEAARKGVITAYIGYDCTAPSLHVGHLMSIMMLRAMQKTGHRPIALMGGGTTKVGDPSGKDESRKLLTADEINANLASIKRTFSSYISFNDSPSGAIMANNADWLDKLEYIAFLRDVGRHFTINRMLTFDSVKMRLEREQPLTFLEFNYMILQAYDFMELGRRHNCMLQMGGSDQWGNIVNGVELARRVDERQLYGLTCPLLTTSSGAKMGKTAKGAVWLNAEALAPYDFWQYWRNAEDADVGRLLRLFTEMPLDEIARLEKLQGAELNEAKKILATEVTRLCHGDAAAEKAAETARAAFEDGAFGGELPVIEVEAAQLQAGIDAYALAVQAGFAKSNGEARRAIKGGGIKLNDAVIDDELRKVSMNDLGDKNEARLSFGKKRHVLIRAKA